MWRKYKYHIYIIAVIALLWLIEMAKPPKVNWMESYSRFHKIPYGCFVLFENLDQLFQSNIVASEEDIVETLQAENALNYIFINNEFEPNYQSLNSLLSFVGNGNNVFIAASNVSAYLLDTLNIDMRSTFSASLNDSVEIKVFSNHTDYKYSKQPVPFKYYDTTNCDFEVLGAYDNGKTNFIRKEWGRGHFYFLSDPKLLSNIHMLKNDNHAYASTVLSHLPKGNVIWDEYYKAWKENKIAAPLAIISNTKGLRQALLVSIFAFLLYMLFKMKREQRVIPIVKPPKNDTVAFTNTIGKLYYEMHDNKDIGKKRVAYFLSDIRKYYHISTQRLDDAFIERISTVTGIEKDEITGLVNNINIVKGTPEITDQRLTELNKYIENFYKSTNHYG